jgi:hypothetical protein
MFGEYLEKQRVRNASVQDHRGCHATLYRIEAGFHFRDS